MTFSSGRKAIRSALVAISLSQILFLQLISTRNIEKYGVKIICSVHVVVLLGKIKINF